jgi:hypothetical protein
MDVSMSVSYGTGAKKNSNKSIQNDSSFRNKTTKFNNACRISDMG